jgi:O-acetyl-ADP-ribose deacetylase (regulator of RNase III)
VVVVHAAVRLVGGGGGVAGGERRRAGETSASERRRRARGPGDAKPEELAKRRVFGNCREHFRATPGLGFVGE